MKILVTSAESELSQAIAISLGVNHEVRLSDRNEIASDQEFIRSDLGHDDSTNDLVRGVGAIVHSGEVNSRASVSDQLDIAMRCTYNLLWAASEEKVQRFIFLSLLQVMDSYEWELAVTERWRPKPGVSTPNLGYHLGEYVCREFARERKLDVVCLRLGDSAGSLQDSPERSVNTSSVYIEDVIQAVEKSLTADLSGWNIFHIQSNVPRKRFLTSAAENALGYVPSERP